MTSVFVLQHQHNLPGGEEDVKMIGVYSSRSKAEEAAKRLSVQPGFRDAARIVDDDVSDHDEGFHIDECEIDEDHWREGFVTMIGDQEMSESQDAQQDDAV